MTRVALKDELHKLEAPALGVVANRAPARAKYGYYGYYGNGRGPEAVEHPVGEPEA